MTSTSITVQWGAVDCIHRNGDITGYSVQYGVQGSGRTQTESVSGGATTEATISGLASATNYTIEVAAVNSVGTGVYSGPITALTSGNLLYITVRHRDKGSTQLRPWAVAFRAQQGHY